MKVKNKIIIFLFTLSFLCTSLLSIVALKAYADNGTNTLTVNVENSIYKDSRVPASQNTASNSTVKAKVNNAYENKTYRNLEELKVAVLNHCREKEPSFSLLYGGNFSDLENNLIDSLLDYIRLNDDYIYFSISRMAGSFGGYDGNVELTFNVNYISSKEEDILVDEKIDSILKAILSPDMNEDKREKAIHNYIVSHVAYDESLQKYSAYNALFDGTAVCQGYALLTYKMLKKAGIENKVVSGTVNNVGHAWNLINIRGNWYHLDCTWDDPVPDKKGRILYNYYNLTDEQILKDHSFDRNAYPKSAVTKYVAVDTPAYELMSTKGFNIINYANNIPLDKKWTIKFSKEVAMNTINDKNIFIVKTDVFDDSSNIPEIIALNNIQCNINIMEGLNKHVSIIPKTPYEPHSTYYLIITDNVFSAAGIKIARPTIMKFSTQ